MQHAGVSAGCRPFVFGTLVIEVGSQILFPAGAAQQVEGEVGATFPFEPDVHVGARAVVAFACGALPTARVTSLDVVVKLEGKSVAQLTLYHLTVLLPCLQDEEEVGLLYVLSSFHMQRRVSGYCCRMVTSTMCSVSLSRLKKDGLIRSS